MNLLPRSHKEFGTASYWEDFFKKRGQKAFEWYGEYLELCGILHKYVKLTDSILVIGCGNSSLSADLYDVGHHSITNIDISDVVIRQMNDKHSKDRPDMKFLKMDMLKMEFPDSEFSVVLDKGTLDAVMTDESDATMETVDKMFAEIDRVLRVGGRYICVSLAQEHIIGKVVKHFSSIGWPVRVCRVEDTEDDEPKDFHMPVFAFILTKFKKMPNMKQILEVSYFNEKVERFDDVNSVLSAVKELQHYGVVRQQLNKSNIQGDHISLDLYSASQNTPRYTLHVVDNKISTGNKFAIFIVPEGRETEWMFSTNEGRKQLSESAGFERLVVVTLHRDHLYDNLDAIKAELSSKVMELSPPKLGNKQVPFLSIGDDIKQRQIQHKGHSAISGDFVIEDVVVDGQLNRRLIFLSNRNAVQSAAKLNKEIVKKKGSKKKTRHTVSHSHLCCQHHSVMVAALAFLDNFEKSIDELVKVCVIGLGGGGLAMFLHQHFRKIHIDSIELDPSVVDIAKQWFSFQEDERMKVHICDGLQYLQKSASEGADKQFDVIFIDVDSKDLSRGLSSPPAAFVDPTFLTTLHSLLSPQGLLVMNLVCRDQSLRNTVVSDLKDVFKRVFVRKVPEEVNEIVFALPTSRKTDFTLRDDAKVPEVLTKNLKTLQSVAKTDGANADEVPTLTYKLTNMRML